MFADEELKKLVVNGIDKQIHYNRGRDPPAPNVPADHFSARWQG